MILSCAGMKEQEELAFQGGCTPDGLMEQAGLLIAAAIRQFLPTPGHCTVFFGKGHNGGDALVAARHLAESGWVIALRPAFPREKWSKLTAQKCKALREYKNVMEGDNGDPGSPFARRPELALDGLLGIGAKGPLRGPVLDAAIEINRLRASTHTRIFAIDLPTGLDADTGAADPNAVAADCTLTIGFAKAGLLADGATPFVGRLAVLSLPDLSFQGEPPSQPAEVAGPRALGSLLKRRPFDAHKGQCGRIGIIAGSSGFLGAAVMAAEACVHAGAGLVTLYVMPDVYSAIATRIAPEIMVHAVNSYTDVIEFRHDVLAIGPGIGASRGPKVLTLIEHATQPMVVDADALNVLATRIDVLGRCAGPRLLTPHPGEMARLLGKREWEGQESISSRREIVENFTAQWPVTLLLKGARTLVGERGRPLSYNTTGNPGMATGGMGDVLTGVCAALAGQGLSLYDSARLGAWLCGRAAEIAVASGGESEESLSAMHLPAHLGRAFSDLRAGCW